MSLHQPSSNPPAPGGFPFRSLALVALGLVAGAGAMALLRPGTAPDPRHGATGAPTSKPQMFQCPMHPQILQDHPGTCPICAMDLVPIEQAQGGASPVGGLATVTIDTARQQLIGLRTAKVVVGPTGGDLRAVVRLAPDETRVRKVNVKVEGYVEKLYADFVGRPVAKGQPLFSLYSPELVSAQQEYLLALKTQRALSGGSLQQSGGDLLDAARRRLLLWDVPQGALDRLERTGEVQRTLTLHSPIRGVITAKAVVEGSRVTPGEAPLEITDLGQLWALAEVYEAELARVKVGQPAELQFNGLEGRPFQGRVAFIDPLLDPKTRTAKVRIEVANPRGELKPDMFGEAVVKGGARKGLLAPLDSVLDSGTRKVVFLALGEGKFEPREVETAPAGDDQVEIRKGLKAGDEVVSGAAFLVDSESRLRAALAQMGEKAAPAGHGH
jgi:membrane fusion protein, copper/silver efflux system